MAEHSDVCHSFRHQRFEGLISPQSRKPSRTCPSGLAVRMFFISEGRTFRDDDDKGDRSGRSDLRRVQCNGTACGSDNGAAGYRSYMLRITRGKACGVPYF